MWVKPSGGPAGSSLLLSQADHAAVKVRMETRVRDFRIMARTPEVSGLARGLSPL
jgi:hypothetical protein